MKGIFTGLFLASVGEGVISIKGQDKQRKSEQESGLKRHFLKLKESFLGFYNQVRIIAYTLHVFKLTRKGESDVNIVCLVWKQF